MVNKRKKAEFNKGFYLWGGVTIAIFLFIVIGEIGFYKEIQSQNKQIKEISTQLNKKANDKILSLKITGLFCNSTKNPDVIMFLKDQKFKAWSGWNKKYLPTFEHKGQYNGQYRLYHQNIRFEGLDVNNVITRLNLKVLDYNEQGHVTHISDTVNEFTVYWCQNPPQFAKIGR